MMLTVTMAAALLAAPPPPQAEPQQPWQFEITEYTYHDKAKPEGWIIEVRGFTRHRQAQKRGMIQAPQPELQIDSIETHYHHDLPAFLKRLEKR